MEPITSNRRHVLVALLMTLTTTGCASAMSSPAMPTIERPAATDQVPLKFKRHDFEAHCYNTIGCRVIYNNHDFSPYAGDQDPEALVSPPPRSTHYRDRWGAAMYLSVVNFPSPARVRWKSLDGESHEAEVDIGDIFKDELVLHAVSADDMAHFFEGAVAGQPSVFLEINDRTISVYMKMQVPTKTPQRAGHPHSNYRDDLFLAWSRTY